VKITAGKVSITFTGENGFHILLQHSASVVHDGRLHA